MLWKEICSRVRIIGRVRVGCNFQWDSQDMLPRECDISAEKTEECDRYR